jgi:3-methyl-2-oxobutanoate hydroxymethyltransferase
MSVNKDIRRVTTHTLHEMKMRGEKISMLTAYDYTMAGIIDAAGIDVILVGDSASNVMAGHETTLPITLDQMIYHASSVVRACKRSLVVVDMPFGTYQGNSKEALNSAIRVMKETGGHAIKMEGGEEIEDSIKRILTAGIPVMGHLGLTPQSLHQLGGYRVQGRTDGDAILEAALALEKAGAFAIVLELVPAGLAAKITAALSIPTVGIGAGVDCDAQVLVWTDLVGLTKNAPKLAKAYRNLRGEILGAAREFADDVRSGSFPSEEQTFH